MSNKSRHRRLLFMMGLVLFSLLGSIWISSNSGMTVYADSKTNITQNGTGSGSVINQQEEPQISTVNSNTTDNTNSSDDQTSQKQVTNTEAQPRAPAEQNNRSMDRSMSSSMLSERPNSVNNITNSVGHDVSSNITSLTASPESINDGGKTTVRVNFDEHAQKIVSGDTITVNWNNSGTVYGQGYQKNIDLNIRGVNVGTLSVTTNKAIFTFNSNINDMENVTGWGEFDLEGRNLANTSDENTGSFSIDSGGQQTHVSVTKGKAGSTSTFYYKTGDMLPSDTDHVRWFLNINNEKGYVSDRIYIKDQIQPGQTLDKGSFDINIDGYSPNHFHGSNAIKNFESAYPGSSITTNVSTGDITVVIPQDQAQLNSFSILYLTSVDDYNQPTFENHSQAWYTENNRPAVEGKEFDHSVSNVNANGGADGNNQTKVSVIKEWDDNNNSARLRPDSIKVQLYANGLLTGKAVTLNSANNWQYTWSGLVKNAKGSTVTYTVKEVSIPNGYRGITTVNGNDIVIKNIHNQTINISGTKTWKDNNNQDGIRPSSITVNLLANGKQVASKKVSASDNWQYSFDNLAADANGQKITYTVTEDAVAGYTRTVDGYNVTNNHTPATVKVSGTKTWKDNNNQDGIRPSSITVNLLANGKQVASKKVSASDNWQYSFDNLAADANGQKITYTVTEDAVAGYTRTVDGYNVTNNHTPATVKVSGTKTWKDNNNQDGIRPSSITVNLLANGKQVASKKVSASDNWQYSFDNLAADANGQKITYTVTEDAVAGYTRTVDGYNVTNNHTPATVKVSGTKTWKDNNNQDGIRPSSITVNLLANGKQVASKKVSASDNWQYSFDNLAADANGQKITYTVTEDAVAGYTRTVDGYNVTNNHTPATVKVSGTKTWKDNNNQDGIRPSSITVNLLANGKQVASKKVSASDNWQYSFDNLAADANGQKITYTVTEDAVAGYTRTVDGYNVTNNHTPATVKVSGTKTWKDNNNQDGIRPSSITVNLLANGKQVASKKVSASDNWQYSFDNLAADANGQKITYTVTEDAVAGYTSTVDGYNITNTHKPTTPTPNKPTTPTPKKPQVPNNGNKVTPKAYTQGKTYEKTGKLPQTGDESSMGMMLIGLVTLLLSLGLVVIRRFTI